MYLKKSLKEFLMVQVSLLTIFSETVLIKQSILLIMSVNNFEMKYFFGCLYQKEVIPLLLSIKKLLLLTCFKIVLKSFTWITKFFLAISYLSVKNDNNNVHQEYLLFTPSSYTAKTVCSEWKILFEFYMNVAVKEKQISRNFVTEQRLYTITNPPVLQLMKEAKQTECCLKRKSKLHCMFCIKFYFHFNVFSQDNIKIQHTCI